jgi:hypothetical protein
MKSQWMSKRTIYSLLSAAAFALVSTAPLHAQMVDTPLTLENPHWNITLSSAGYSDLLLDNTPGSVGREYLSGEWAAAVRYNSVAPIWLEPKFIFPDWDTNSNFSIVDPIHEIGTNADGLPIAESVIENGVLRITQRFEMLDSTLGIPMGTSPASSATGGSVKSNRYVLSHSYILTNYSGNALTDVELFQFLHSLEATRSVYDDRFYAGRMDSYQYDITQRGQSDYIDPSDGLFDDYISFHSALEPVAMENGMYGTPDVDDHAIGKPSVGTHLSVEAGTLNDVDFIEPGLWVAGAQQYALGTLAPEASVSHTVLLSILTGTTTSGGDNSSGTSGGGSSEIGGIDYEFERVDEPGSFFSEYLVPDEEELAEHIAEGEFTALDFLAGPHPQMWELEFDGEFSNADENLTDDVKLVLGYDSSQLPPGTDESELAMYRFNGTNWEELLSAVNPSSQTITTYTSSLSYFALGNVVPIPEPGSAGLLGCAALALATMRSRKRGAPAIRA